MLARFDFRHWSFTSRLLPEAERALADRLEGLGAEMTQRRLQLIAPKSLAIA